MKGKEVLSVVLFVLLFSSGWVSAAPDTEVSSVLMKAV